MHLRLPLPVLPAGDRSFAWALLAAVALHAAALAWVRPQQWLPLPASRPGGSLQVSLRTQPAPVPEARPGTQAPTGPGSREVRVDQPLPEPVAEPPAAMPQQADARAGDGAGPPRPVEYLPRERLTRPPRPQSHVALAFPPVDGYVDLKVRLSLYIDEQGSVRDLRLDTPDVPPVFAQAIHAAFGSARFSPGEVDEVPVPSVMRLEVEFSARPRD